MLVLELIAAHCADPHDHALVTDFRDDFFAVLRAAKVDEQSIERRFNDAFSTVRSLGLCRTDSPIQQVQIAKQWWELLHNELRRRGRRR